jgi:sugar/nucleoside kinase (ribokinase family)
MSVVRSRAVVIGGATLDILGGPAANRSLVLETSNPGEVRQHYGGKNSHFSCDEPLQRLIQLLALEYIGVARNIAECMSRLGSQPLLLSAVGADVAGDGLIHHLESIGMDTQGVKRCKDMRTACYAALFDGSGDLLTAVADMGVMSEVVRKLLP